LLPGWALTDCPLFMQRFNNWYKRACRLGLRTIYARHHPDVFGTKGPEIFDITFDFEDIQHMFYLKKLGIEMVRLWCMMQTFDSIVLNKKIRYLDPAAICEAKHTSPKWMKDDDDYLKSFETKRQNKRNKKDFIKRPSQMLRPTYDDMMGRHGCHICVIPHPKSLDCVSYTTKALKNSRIGLVGLVNHEIPRILRYSIIGL